MRLPKGLAIITTFFVGLLSVGFSETAEIIADFEIQSGTVRIESEDREGDFTQLYLQRSSDLSEGSWEISMHVGAVRH